MEERKRELLFGRIRPRLRELGLESCEQYVEYLQANESETQEFINLVTTNETLFFRTPIVWDYFRREFLPKWFAENPEGTLKVWSAAASSGEEACSIAMACEEFRILHPSFKFRIYGSDISTDVLEPAKAGQFRAKTTEELKKKHPELVSRYFREQPNGDYKVVAPLWANVEFTVHNLHRKPGKIQFYDIVFLRNVLIYFNDRDQELVLNNIYGSMKEGAMLILGESESLARLKTPYTFFRPLIYTKGGK